MDVLEPSWLQYGALGLLGMVLAAIGTIMYFRDKKSAERLEKQDGWLRELVREDRVERQTHMESWKEMTQNNIKASEELVVTIKRVNDTMEQNRMVQESRHNEVMMAIDHSKK